MRCNVEIATVALLTFCSLLQAQYQAPSERLVIAADTASTRHQPNGSIIEARGHVSIEMDRAHLSADGAVLWLIDKPSDHDTQTVQIALIGHARVEQKSSTRSGDRLLVTTLVRGSIRLTAQPAAAGNAQDVELFHEAETLRAADDAPAVPAAAQLAADHPATRPASARRKAAPTTQPNGPLLFQAHQVQTRQDDEGLVAIVLDGDVTLFQQRPNGDILEMRCERAVIFTTVKSLKEMSETQRGHQLADFAEGAYLEGDVRITYTVAKGIAGEQRLSANRVYYEFATDRAILTDAVIHTVDVAQNVPVVMRAKIVRQLANGEYDAKKAELSTSSFALPSLAIAADRLYVRTEEVPGEEGGEEVYFKARNATLPIFGIPIFYWPSASGTLTDRGLPLRGLGIVNESEFGTGVETEWGLFESLGVPPPKDLDVAYRLDYFSERGPGFGLSAAYRGGFITDTTREPVSFEGDFRAYFVNDHGTDNLGRFPISPYEDETLRGRVDWQHQHFFPDDWEVQLRAGWVSDATFMEQWFRREFETGLPLDVSAYAKHQVDTEAFTLLLDAQPSKEVTIADYQQEQFEVERLPEVGYRRIGDGLADDQLTFFSDNTADLLHFQQSRTPLIDQGFNDAVPNYSPGIPSLGTTGVTDKVVARANFRQELDYPFTVGPLRLVPYTMGILTQYSDSPTGGQKTRLLVGGGGRITTDFWKVDPTAESELLDIHQLRHIIEPQLNLFTSVQNIHHDDVYIYDEPIDAVSDLSAMQLALRQTWQTKRGGPGQWRSVDVFNLNVDLDLFDNKPRHSFLNPFNFRGLYFPSLPEASVPRDAVNANASWRLSDETVLLSDFSQNLDKEELATAAIGVLVRRGDRLSYYVEDRYIDILHSNIASIHLDYVMTSRYAVSLDQAFDFDAGKNVTSSISVQRRFDTLLMTLSFYRDVTTNQSGVNFSLTPLGLGRGLDSGTFANGFNR